MIQWASAVDKVPKCGAIVKQLKTNKTLTVNYRLELFAFANKYSPIIHSTRHTVPAACSACVHSVLVQYANWNSVYGKIALIFAGPEDNQKPLKGETPKPKPETFSAQMHFPMQILSTSHLSTAHRCQYLSVFCLIKTFCQYFMPSCGCAPPLVLRFR